MDRVGAGDAVLCVTSLCVALGAPAEVTAFLGNVVGAEAVAILGNQRSIERIPLYRHVECLLKMHKREQRHADEDARSSPAEGRTRRSDSACVSADATAG